MTGRELLSGVETGERPELRAETALKGRFAAHLTFLRTMDCSRLGDSRPMRRSSLETAVDRFVRLAAPTGFEPVPPP
jgi:hypothetical protein